MKEILARYRNEIEALEAQHLGGRRVLPGYSGGRPEYSHGRLAVSVSKDPEPTYTAYYTIRLFELWNDLLKDLLEQIHPDPSKLKRAANRFEWCASRGYLEKDDLRWPPLRNDWVHDGKMPDVETFAELLACVRFFLENMEKRFGG